MTGDLLFETYKLLVEEVRDARRARRELSNVFLTLNLAGMGALGFIAIDPGKLKPELFVLCAAALILTCGVWYSCNRYYKVVVREKYKILKTYEDELQQWPLRDEYAKVKGTASYAFRLEGMMPWLFALGYGLFVAVQTGGMSLESVSDWIGPDWNTFLQRIGVR
jgi:hypothetical protein